jgi:hypothetical protein
VTKPTQIKAPIPTKVRQMNILCIDSVDAAKINARKNKLKKDANQIFRLHNFSISVRKGCQMVGFQTKNPNSDKFWRALDWKMFKIFYGHLEYFMEIWDIL